MLSIAIDGPAGAGKSTLAKRLAESIGFLYVDTGAIYRSVGLFVHKQNKNCERAQEVISVLPDLELAIVHEADGLQHMLMNGEDVTFQIRQNEVSRLASLVSRIPEVRAFLLKTQRNMAKQHSVVMDGRDIGTVILPDAALKIFLTASVEERAKRRHAELLQKGSQVSFEQICSEISNRDEQDSNRTIAPLKAAEDAIIVDTSKLDLEESYRALRGLVEEKLGI